MDIPGISKVDMYIYFPKMNRIVTGYSYHFYIINLFKLLNGTFNF